MKIIKCKCGSEKMRIEKRETCNRCENNKCINNDDDTCEAHGEPCNGMNYDCPDYYGNAQENGQCDMGSCGDLGCHIYQCAECGKVVDYVTFSEA